ncbi:MAG TPA: HAD-IIIC family phosphatase, partial [Chloroflexota bacterium]
SETCSAWDSLGQVAIATALFDRYGIGLDPPEIFRLCDLDDLVRVVGGHGPLAVSGADELSALPALDELPLLDPQVATRTLAAHFDVAPPGAKRLHVTIAATFTAEPIAPTLKVWGRALGFDLECDFAAYDQVAQTLLDGGGLFAANLDGVNVVLARAEDLIGGRSDEVLRGIAHFGASVVDGTGQFIIGSLPPPLGAIGAPERACLEAVREQWRRRLMELPGIELLEFAGLVERLGGDTAASRQHEVLLRAPYSPRLYQELAIALVRQIRARRQPPAKVIALDCDNTLWGGIVGEVGLEGILLGPDGAGRAFVLLQRALKQLQQAGVLLVVVSRNEDHDVRRVFAEHPEMVLRLSDIAAWRVNWKHKSDNLAELAKDLNVALDAFVLLDDDPLSRAEVAARRPEVHVVPLPADPVDYCNTLSRLWLFDGAQRSDVDAVRTRLLQDEQRRRVDEAAALSLGDYLAGLNLELEVGHATTADWPRVAQLTQRTNQFNLSLKRRTLEQVRTLARGASILVLNARDRFGDYGLVGLAVVRPGEASPRWEVDTLLLSCRALGRGVEDAFMHGIARFAVQHGATALVASYVEGPRNGQIIPYLARMGFVEVNAGTWKRELSDLPPLAAHVSLRLATDGSMSSFDVEGDGR